MLNVSVCASDKLCSDVDDIISSLPFGPFERDRLLSMKSDGGRRLSLSAWVTLAELLCKSGYDSSRDLTVIRTKERKPYFESLPLHFSLSHAEGAVSAAICDTPVGVDIEWIDPSRDISAISGRFFSVDEQRYISLSSDRALAFFSLWTKKEAYAKLTGKGLASICSGDIPSWVHLYQYVIELGHRRGVLSVCCESAEDINVYDLYKEFNIYELQN